MTSRSAPPVEMSDRSPLAIDRDWVKDAVRLIEASFIPSVVDRMIRAPAAASIAAIHWLETVIGRKCGGSAGTNVYGALTLAEEMIAEARAGSIVTLICDPGERYLSTYYDADWIAGEGL
ncbi:MAG TPA: hypothetical protein VKR62_15320, partial [Roseiarcus sp.]|nr:hypothetical protein [Roseiarcus sp.]